MVKRFIKFAGKAAEKAKSVLFADPKLLYDDERQLINQPFFFVSGGEIEQSKKGVLLVHGWTSTPYEVRRLGKYLNENGYTVLGIQLTGHGTVPKDLEDVKWKQWTTDVREGYEKLKQTCEQVYIIGTSIGANLAMILAKENPEVAGIVLMATPYKLRMEKVGLFFVKLLLKFKKKYRKKFYPPTFGRSSMITRLISYQSYPVKNLLEVYEVVKESRKDLFKITQPCFLMQSTHDHIVEKKSMEIIYAGIGSSVKKKEYIKKAYHTFISDTKNQHIFQDILYFLEEN